MQTPSSYTWNIESQFINSEPQIKNQSHLREFNGTLRETHAARQLQESSWALKICSRVIPRGEYVPCRPCFADFTLYFTWQIAPQVYAKTVKPIWFEMYFLRIHKITRIVLGDFWETFGSPRGPPGGAQEAPRRAKPIYKHLSGVKLPIARLWRPVCYQNKG